MWAQEAWASRAVRATRRRVAVVAAVLLAAAAPAWAQTPTRASGDAPIVVGSLGGGFIEFLFGGGREEASPRRARPQPRTAPLPIAPAPTREREAAPSQPAGWGLSYCVRTCDGYAFPLGTMRTRADARAHRRSCAAACPSAATALYVGSRRGGFARARTVADGTPYSAHPHAFRHRRERVENCSCAAARSPAARWASGDATLRRGDVLVTGGGALVFDGADFVDFREDRAAPRVLRRRIDAMLGVSAREARLAAWRRDNPEAAAPIPPARSAMPGAESLAAFAGWDLRTDGAR